MSSDGGLMSYADLEARWQPAGATPQARRKWVLRRVEDLGLRAVMGTRGDSVRFRLASVLAAEEKKEGRRACYA